MAKRILECGMRMLFFSLVDAGYWTAGKEDSEPGIPA
jgi:hypothetical protein